MSAIATIFDTYSGDQLRAAFDRVKDPDDWKAPICAVVPLTEKDVTGAAVEHFCGVTPIFRAMRPTRPGLSGYYVIESEGYRLGPCGP